jgi:hypothetical protein
MPHFLEVCRQSETIIDGFAPFEPGSTGTLEGAKDVIALGLLAMGLKRGRDFFPMAI